MESGSAVPGPPRADVLVALVCVALSVAAILAGSALFRAEEGIALGGVSVIFACGVGTAQALALVMRRMQPTGCLVFVATLQVVLVTAVPDGAALQGVAQLVAAYTVGVLLPLRRAVPIVAVIAVLETSAVSLLGAVSSATDLVPGLNGILAYGFAAVLDYLAPALLGAFVYTRRAYAEVISAQAREQVAAERDRADRAVLDERTRMAREVHDVAAHHLSGMVVQAGAVERLIDSDPPAARAATRELRLQGRQTLADLRTAVGVLREHPPLTSARSGPLGVGAPVPGVASLGRLIDSASHDASVSTEVSGESWPLPPIADATVYRVVQEALSNARQHAVGAPSRVRLAWEQHQVTVTIENDDPPAPRRSDSSEAEPVGTPTARPGLGLIGMHERAQVVHATLQAGPTPSGGWKVHLSLPRPRDFAIGEAP